MRKSVLLWLFLAAFCGTALFHTSQKVHVGSDKLSQLNRNITKEEESIRVLNAEWSYLTQPARLEKLSQTYLKLVPLKGTQFVKLEDIPLRPAAPEVMPEPAAEKNETPAVERIITTEKNKTPVSEAAPVPAAVSPAAPPVAAVKKPVPQKQPLPKAAEKPFKYRPAQLSGHDKKTYVWKPEPKRSSLPPPRTANNREFGDVMKSLGVD